MNFPSTLTDGANPALGAIVSNVDSSHGVRLDGGSTGGIVTVTGGDANISLAVAGKGTGFTRLGNSSAVARIGASTSGIAAIERYLVEFTEPDSPASTYVDSTYTVTGLTTNAVLHFTPRLTLAAGYTIGDVRCSTADELTIRWVHAGGSTASGSSNRGTLLAFKF
jgi:hypothetical protein